MTEKKKDVRSRSWAIVVYPESAPKNWREMLDDTRIAWVESPLHDKDVNPDQTIKKPHWHVILMYGSKKSYSQVLEITEMLHAPIPQKIQNIKGAVRYLVHTDNPEKYQYNREDIVCHGGAEVEQYFELSSVSRERTLWDIMKFIRDEKITSYSAFIGYCQDTDNWEWFSIATKYYTLAIRTLIDSVYQDNRIRDTQGNQHSEEKVRQDNILKVKELSEKGYSQRKIADTLVLSLGVVNKYLHM